MSPTMDRTRIEQASARLRSLFADPDGRVPPEPVMCARAERQLLHLLQQHGAYEPLRPHYAQTPADEGLSFEQAVRIIGGFAQEDRDAFMRLSFLMAVLMKDPAPARDAGAYLGLPEELRDGSFYAGPAYGKA